METYFFEEMFEQVIWFLRVSFELIIINNDHHPLFKEEELSSNIL